MDSSASLEEVKSSTSISSNEEELTSLSEDSMSMSKTSQDVELQKGSIAGSSTKNGKVDLTISVQKAMVNFKCLDYTSSGEKRLCKRKLTLSQPLCENDIRFGEPRFKRRAISTQPNVVGLPSRGSTNWYIEYKHQKQLALKNLRAYERLKGKLECASNYLIALSSILD